MNKNLFFDMLIGLPASGKSTFANTILRYSPTVEYISSDAIRKELYGSEEAQWRSF